jgi:tRNA(His) guanylyltransferase
MAGSKYEYVRSFEADDALLRDTWIVVRIDGRGFSRFTTEHGFAKPNDARGAALMNQAAAVVLREWGDAVLAFAQSDECSFVLPRRCTVFGRRASKIATGISSLFAAAYVVHWPTFFPGVRLRAPPAFDGRCVAYPTLRAVCDYVRWRQVDVHINALHNEAFWALVLRGAWWDGAPHLGNRLPCTHDFRRRFGRRRRRRTTPLTSAGGLSTEAAYERLRGTVSEEKHELLHGSFGINYARVS